VVLNFEPLMGTTSCTSCQCGSGKDESATDTPAKIMQRTSPHSTAPGVRNINDFLAQYDGEHFLKQSNTESVLGVSDKMNLVRQFSTNKLMACRRFPRSAVQLKQEDLQAHFDKLKTLQHPHITQFVEGYLGKEELVVVYDPDGNQLLLKYLQNVKEFGEREVSDCVRQLAIALSVAHESGFAHGHLTPWSVNVVQAQSSFKSPACFQIKLDNVGLGMSVLPSTLAMAFPSLVKGADVGEDSNDPELRSAHVKTVGSLPPETAWGEVACQTPGQLRQQVCKTDIWGLGVIAFYLLTGRLPFMPTMGQPIQEFLKTVRGGEVPFGDDIWNPYPSVAKDCIASMLRINGSLRPEASSILKHPWIRLAKDKLSKSQVTGILRNIFQNAREGPLRRMVLRIIAHGNAPPQHRITAESIFRFLDSSNDGQLGVQELKDAIRKFLPKAELADEDIDILFDKIDNSGDGSLDFMEFLSVSLNGDELLSQDRLLSVFKTFDTDGGGTITLDEIERVAKQLSADGGESIDEVLAEVKAGAGGDGLLQPIDFAEFSDLVTMPASQAKAWWSTAKRNANRVMSIFGGSVEIDKVEVIDLNVPTASQSVYVGTRSTGLRRQMTVSNKQTSTSTTQNVPLLNTQNDLPMELPPTCAPEPEWEAVDARIKEEGNADEAKSEKARGRSPIQLAFDKARGVKTQKPRSEERRKTKDGMPASPVSVASTRPPESEGRSPSPSPAPSNRSSRSSKRSPISTNLLQENRRRHTRT